MPEYRIWMARNKREQKRAVAIDVTAPSVNDAEIEARRLCPERLVLDPERLPEAGSEVRGMLV
jgi:hypothetical protein